MFLLHTAAVAAAAVERQKRWTVRERIVVVTAVCVCVCDVCERRTFLQP